jgi:hypothetical protein
VGVVGISWFKSHCLPDEKEGHQVFLFTVFT